MEFSNPKILSIITEEMWKISDDKKQLVNFVNRRSNLIIHIVSYYIMKFKTGFGFKSVKICSLSSYILGHMYTRVSAALRRIPYKKNFSIPAEIEA